MIPKDGINIYYLKAVFRYRLWWVLVPFFMIFLGTVIYCIKAPRIFLSSTLILVRPPEVPTDYVRSSVRSDFKSRIDVIRDHVLSRPRLEEVINKLDLYAKVRSAGTMTDAVKLMQRNISVQVIEEEDSLMRRHPSPVNFRVSYTGEDPAKVKDVTSAIANLFIEENARLRKYETISTSKFLEKELDRLREGLRQREVQLRNFKEEHFGLLPDQISNNYQMLNQAQQHLDSLNESLQQVENRKVLLQTQLARLESLEADSLEALGLRASGIRAQTPPTLEELRLELKSLKSRYSDKHPDVRRLEAAIAKRAREKKPGSYGGDSQGLGESPPPPEEQRGNLAQSGDILTQLELANKQIIEHKNDIRKTRQEIEEYRRRIARGPEIEQMYIDLSRDYDEIAKNYQSLLDKKTQSQLAENLESDLKGEQFTILENAYLPRKPIEPKVLPTLGMGFMLGVACGLGLVLLREYSDQSFWWSARELEKVIGLPVLVSIPEVQTDLERRMNNFKKLGTAFVLLIMSSTLLYALFILWKKDPTFLSL